MAQLVVVNEILVAERDAEQPLRHHRLDRVLDLGLDAAVIEAGREPGHQADRAIGCTEQQRPGVRRHFATIERGHHLAALDHFIPKQVPATLCRHRGTPLVGSKSFQQNDFRRFSAPMHLLPVRNPG